MLGEMTSLSVFIYFNSNEGEFSFRLSSPEIVWFLWKTFDFAFWILQDSRLTVSPFLFSSQRCSESTTSSKHKSHHFPEHPGHLVCADWDVFVLCLLVVAVGEMESEILWWLFTGTTYWEEGKWCLREQAIFVTLASPSHGTWYKRLET